MVAVPIGAYGTARVFRTVASLVEPLRDLLVKKTDLRGQRPCSLSSLPVQGMPAMGGAQLSSDQVMAAAAYIWALNHPAASH